MNSQLILQKIREFGEETKTKKYYQISKKDKSLIRLLFMMSLVFFITNIPMAIGRIIQSFDISTEDKFFKEFAVVTNVMEIFFASSNFYLYCFCNLQFRRNVSFLSTFIFKFNIYLQAFDCILCRKVRDFHTSIYTISS